MSIERIKTDSGVRVTVVTIPQAVASLRAVLEGQEDLDHVIRDVKMEDIITEFEKDLRGYEDKPAYVSHPG